MKFRILLLSFFISFSALAQNTEDIKKAQQLLDKYGEVCLKFAIFDQAELSALSRKMSVDNFKDNEVTAYCNKNEFADFLKLGYNFKTVNQYKERAKAVSMATTLAGMANWDKYPTYQVYVEMMEKFAADYPHICKLETIGTTPEGRKILALKISDNVNVDEAEPEFFYTSTMHGDETAGSVLLLRLADSLLSTYALPTKGSSNYLVDNFELFINPFANPDGTYAGGNSTVAYSTRYNSNYVDINRNFPDFVGGNHPDGNSWQSETIAMMDYAEAHDFVLSVNFHGGIEVVNYPWDVWTEGYSDYKTHPDRDWFFRISTNYAVSAQENSPAGYMTGLGSGVTNGGDWYVVYGGRQDYMNYYHNCKELTIELSDVKTLSSTELNNYWNYNKQALINYIYEAGYGFRGSVKNINNEPIEAKVEILNHDEYNSHVYSTAENGDYYRPIAAGTYSLQFSADGYQSKVFDNQVAIDGQATYLDVVLQETSTGIADNSETGISVFPIPATTILTVIARNIQASKVEIYDISGKKVISLPFGESQIKQINISELENGVYFCRINSDKGFLRIERFIKK